MAELRLDDPAKALDDLKALIATKEDDVQGLPYRAIARARYGRKDDARTDLAKLETLYLPGHFKHYIAAVVAAELGEEPDPELGALEAAVAKDRQDDDLRFDAARAFALASRPIAARDLTKARRLASRAVQLLKDGDADPGRMDDEPAFDPIRDDPEFIKLMNASHPDRRYAAVWTTEADVDCAVIQGCDPADHRRRAGELITDGYHPVAWTAARITREGPVVTASVWHRPRASEAEKDRLAARQARAAVALIRMGRGAEVWEFLRHSPDPRLRSFIVNWVKPLGADPGAIAAAFARIGDPDRRRADRPSGTTEAILFDRDASIRRAMILALGTYGEGDLPAVEREPLISRLIGLYRDDPDAGVHAAAEWALRQWRRERELDDADADLKRRREPGDRRWYLNGEGQTFAVIAGPDHFWMGSPAADTERNGSSETRHPIAIPRRFAIATKEVTVEQFQRFLKSHGQFDISSRGTLKKYSPRPDGPWIAATWYAAAAYCNWLSAREGLSECYRRSADGSYAEGMTIPVDVLKRTGYRLPTEAEWEYACRAGAATSRYHGASIELLPRYTWYQSNSEGRARPCGSLLPNDLGLFDMLGNVYEWCQDRDDAYRPSRRRSPLDVTTIDDTTIEETVVDKQSRMFRGGTFTGTPDELRSSARSAELPRFEYYLMGFRLARTLEPGR
jgi:formylglycine-generating enzyme required for sulfatase activity